MVTPTICSGFVKQVLSGDSIVIREPAKDGPPTSLTLVLSNILCPKIGRKPSAAVPGTDDEPFGWMAREFVRSKLIGKEICYFVEKEISSERAYGCIFLGKTAGSPNLTHILVAEGLAKVRKNMSQASIEKSQTMQTLIELENTAIAEKKGLWSESPAGRPRNICWAIDDPVSFYETHSKKPLKAIVEYVRDGNAMTVQLLPIDGDQSETYYNFMVLLSGIKTPGSKMVDGSRVYEEHSLQAQFFVESRLLNREVTVILEGITNNQFVASVLHPCGNIAVFLLQNGLARCLEWNLAIVSPLAGGPDAYRNAEQMAKQKRLNIWRDYVPPAAPASKSTPKASKTNTAAKTEHTGIVVEVGNGDNILVKCQDGVTRKFFLSSIRAPKPPADKEGKPQLAAKPLYNVPYVFEAREFLRKRLVGKQVKVLIDYVQPKPEGSNMDDRVCATVTIGDTNAAEGLVQRGLATVLTYRNPTDSRARFYDQLLEAELQAQKKMIGIFSKGPVPVHRYTELDKNIAKSRQFLYSLQRVGNVDTVVEFVASASRFRVHIPRENLLCTALTAGIVCPRASRKLPNKTEEGGEPFGDEARDYAREIVMQRDVRFEADGMDRLGNLIGWITLPSEVKVNAAGQKSKKAGKKAENGSNAASFSSSNLSVVLVARGYATVNQAPNTQRTNQYSMLMKAEAFAQSNNLGMWSSEEFRNTWKAQQDAVEADALDTAEDNSADRAGGFVSINDLKSSLPTDAESNKKAASLRLKSADLAQVTIISNTPPGNNGLRFFVQLNNKAGLVNQMNRDLNAPGFPNADAAANFQPKRGMVCAARFSIDNLWYRARVLRISGKKVTVVFIDFGNEETIDLSVQGAPRMASLSKQIASKEPLATEYRLACVQLPPDMDYKEMALDYLAGCIMDRDIRLSPATGPAIACGKEDTRPVPGVYVYVAGAAASSSTSAADFEDVAENLLRDGLVYTENVRMPPDVASRYAEAQQAAMSGRKNIWRYGDIRDDDA